MEQKIKESFFTKDPTFYRTLFPLLITVALQNIVAYSVNMADNIMLGSYSQNALSGAATVNQIFSWFSRSLLESERDLLCWGPNTGDREGCSRSAS